MTGDGAIRKSLEALHAPGDVFAMRVLGENRAIAEGYFDNLEKAAREAARFDARQEVVGVYATLNPVALECLARAANRCKQRGAAACTDRDIARRRWLLADLDANRPSGISATNEQLAAAIERANALRDDLAACGWPSPVECMSGNGAHLRYRIDEPNDDATRELVKRCLGALDQRFSDAAVTIDTSVFNAGRIARLPGTVAKKGDNTADRPHRRSALLRVPSELVAVPRHLLEELAATLPEPKGIAQSAGLDLDAFIARNSIEVQRTGPWNGGRKFILRACLFDAAHTGTSAALLQLANGAIVYKCQHNGCARRGWFDVRELFEPTEPRGRAMTEQRAQSNGQAGNRALELVYLSEVTPEPVSWLWRGRIPAGKVTLLVGDPGAGKSFASLAIAATVTHGGALPDDDSALTLGRVLAWNGEDGLADTVRPRAEAAGVALERFASIEGTCDDAGRHVPFSLDDAAALADKVRELRDVALVIVDPVAALLGGTDTHRDAEVRARLQPLVDLARETGVAVLAVMHLRKSEAQRTLYRVGGSIGFVAMARSVLLAAVDPESGRRAIAPVKCNLCAPPQPVEYRIDDEGRFWWSGVDNALSAEHLLRTVQTVSRGAALSEAVAFYRRVLSDGARPVNEVNAEADALGISQSTRERARKKACVKSYRVGGLGEEGQWMLALDDSAKALTKAPIAENEGLSIFEGLSDDTKAFRPSPKRSKGLSEDVSVAEIRSTAGKETETVKALTSESEGLSAFEMFEV
jgi:hypothetical protein